MTTLRTAGPADAEQIARLFHETIHAVNSRDYTPAQLEAWSPAPRSAAHWAARQATRCTFVALEDEELVGFVELEPPGHVDCLYVHRERQGRGIATRLLARLVAEAEERGAATLVVEASLTARPFFEQHGFRVVREQSVDVRGVALTNFAMERELGGKPLKECH